MSTLSQDAEDELAVTLDALTSQVETLTRSLGGLHEEISAVIDKFGDEMRYQEQNVADLTLMVREVGEAAVSAAAAIEVASADALDALEVVDRLLEMAMDGASPLGQVSDLIDEAADATQVGIKEFVEDWVDLQRGALDEKVLEAGEGLREALADPLYHAVQDVFEKLTGAMNEAVEEAMQPIANRIAETVEEVLQDFVERMTRGTEETRHEHLGMRPVIDALRPPVEALIAQVERVTSLAAMVGMG